MSMSLESKSLKSQSLQKVPVEQLEEGAFVYSLDRPICETPFPLQGFYIRSFEDIAKLAEYCRFVVVDTLRSPLAGPDCRVMPSRLR